MVRILLAVSELFFNIYLNNSHEILISMEFWLFRFNFFQSLLVSRPLFLRPFINGYTDAFLFTESSFFQFLLICISLLFYLCITNFSDKLLNCLVIKWFSAFIFIPHFNFFSFIIIFDFFVVYNNIIYIFFKS